MIGKMIGKIVGKMIGKMIAYLGDDETIKQAMNAVANQGKAK
jgi:putative exporter of polyketide antibiotics